MKQTSELVTSGRFLGIDMGGTATRWVVIDAAGQETARGTTKGATGHLFNADARGNFAAAVAAIAAEPQVAGVDRVHMGATGLGQGAVEEARRILAETLALTPSAVSVGDDMDLAFRTIFAPGAGHLISVGTGSIGLHIAADGQPVRVGGRGILIDDGGSGSWIALRALDRLYRIVDETGGYGDAGVLAEKLFDAMGGEGWDVVRAYIYGWDRGTIGLLARAVGAAAEAGDRVAQGVIAQAAEELARLGRALVARAGEHPIGFVGGLLAITPDFGARIQAALDGHAVIFPRIDAALGAARIAREGATVER